MTVRSWIKSEVGYGEELVRSAIAGGRCARDKALGPEPAGAALARSLRNALPWLTVGASIGFLGLCWRGKRRSPPAIAVFGLLLGAVAGFGTSMTVSTWHITEETVRGAMKNVNTVRDAHWLANNPIDYA